MIHSHYLLVTAQLAIEHFSLIATIIPFPQVLFVVREVPKV